jgi:hypothetical protein
MQTQFKIAFGAALAELAELAIKGLASLRQETES